MTVEIQSVWFRSDKWTKSASKTWCGENEFKTNDYATKLDEDGNISHHIWRQFPPDDKNIVEDSWATIADDFPEGVSARTCVRENEDDKSMDTIFKSGEQSEDNPFKFVMTTDHVDRVGDIIDQDGISLKSFKKNPIALFAHNHDYPVGTWAKVKKDEVGGFKRHTGDLVLMEAGLDRDIDRVRNLIEQRIIKAVSVGFMPTDWEIIRDKEENFTGIHFTASELLECSPCSVPCNPHALQAAKDMGMDAMKAEKMFMNQAVRIGEKRQPLARIRLLDNTNKPKYTQSRVDSITDSEDKIVLALTRHKEFFGD